MKERSSRWVMGSALTLAAIAVAIDHTRHSLPEPDRAGIDNNEIIVILDEAAENPCGLTGNPCGLTAENPCGLRKANPCSL